jgi:hypothetical protein
MYNINVRKQLFQLTNHFAENHESYDTHIKSIHLQIQGLKLRNPKGLCHRKFTLNEPDFEMIECGPRTVSTFGSYSLGTKIKTYCSRPDTATIIQFLLE